MAQTKRHQIEKAITRVLSDEYGFDPDSSQKAAKRITSEIYFLVPARVISAVGVSKNDAPEIELFTSITGYRPAPAAHEEIIMLMTGKDENELRSIYKEWCFKTNNRNSATWLKWVKGNKVDKPLVVK